MTKKAKAPPSAEQQVRNELDMLTTHGRVIPEPTILYKEGQRVHHGSVKHSVVTEVLDGGKILKLHETCTNENYGKPYDYERDMHIAWFDVEPWRSWAGVEPIHQRDRLRINYYQTMLRGLISRNVDFEPDYQRGFVWTLPDKQDLIESIFLEVDIGKFVFRKLPYAPHPAAHYEIVDGKQRLSALTEFFEGRFAWRKTLFRDMHPRDRSHFENYAVSVADLWEGTTRAQVLEVFVRLNTSGRPQDPEHLDHVKSMLKKAKP